tara:strand:- start:269 stop:604 length:336 start_codon:yes stop_codon:yes gene_type:complete
MDEPIITARFETYGAPVEIMRGGYSMVKVGCQEDALQILEALIKALPALPKRHSPYPDGHMLRDGLGNAEFVKPAMGRYAYGVHVVGGQEWLLNESLRCMAPHCPVCRPTE